MSTSVFKLSFVDKDEAFINGVVVGLVRMGVTVKFVAEMNPSKTPAPVAPPKTVAPPAPPKIAEARGAEYFTRRKKSVYMCRKFDGVTGVDRVMKYLADNNGHVKTDDLFRHMVSMGYKKASVYSFLSNLRSTNTIIYDHYSVISGDKK